MTKEIVAIEDKETNTYKCGVKDCTGILESGTSFSFTFGGEVTVIYCNVCYHRYSNPKKYRS